MFEGLKSTALENAKVDPMSLTEVTFDQALELAADSCMDSLFASDSYDNDIQATFENLLALEAAMATHGVSRALLAFADRDGSLSAAIPSIPSLESMTADLSVKESAAAIEGVGTTIVSYGKAILQSYKNAFTWTTQAENRILVWNHIIDGVEKNMDEKHFSLEKAKKIEAKVVPFQALIALQKAYARAPKAALELWGSGLPKEEKEYAPWLAKVKAEFEPIFRTEQAKIKDNGTLSIPFSRWILLKVGEKGNLADKGYNSESAAKEVISGYRKLLGSYDALKTVNKTIQKHVEDMTKEGTEYDRRVVTRALTVCKNLTRALLWNGVWGVSGVSMHAIMNIKKAYVSTKDNYEGEAEQKK